MEIDGGIIFKWISLRSKYFTAAASPVYQAYSVSLLMRYRENYPLQFVKKQFQLVALYYLFVGSSGTFFGLS